LTLVGTPVTTENMSYTTLSRDLVFFADLQAGSFLPAILHRLFPYRLLSLLAHTCACMSPRA